MRNIVTVGVFAATVVVCGTGSAHAAPAGMTASSCQAQGGQYSTQGAVRVCSTVTAREEVGPVLTRMHFESRNDSSYGETVILTGESQRVYNVEVTRLQLETPGRDAEEFLTERQISTAVRPLSCQRNSERGTSRPQTEVLPLDVCQERRLFGAPFETLALVAGAPDVDTFRRGDFQRVCAAVNGTHTRHGAVRSCSLVAQRTIADPVVTQQALERDDGSHPYQGFATTWTGTAQRLAVVETVTTFSRRGNTVTKQVLESPVSSQVTPLSCHSSMASWSHRLYWRVMEYTDVSACQDRSLLPA